MQPSPKAGRYFLALWPTHDVRQAIVSSTAGWLQCLSPAWRSVAADRFHMTLVFLGHLDARKARRLVACEERLARCQPGAFRMRLDRVGHFEPGIAWIGCSTPPASLIRLQEQLRSEMNLAGIVSSSTLPFVPHVTLARAGIAADPPPPTCVAPVTWDVHEWALVRSRSAQEGQGYRVMARYPLQPSS